jgi:hypothetical protein
MQMYYFYGPTSVLASIGESGFVAERGGSALVCVSAGS